MDWITEPPKWFVFEAVRPKDLPDIQDIDEVEEPVSNNGKIYEGKRTVTVFRHGCGLVNSFENRSSGEAGGNERSKVYPSTFRSNGRKDNSER